MKREEENQREKIDFLCLLDGMVREMFVCVCGRMHAVRYLQTNFRIERIDKYSNRIVDHGTIVKQNDRQNETKCV